MQRGVMTVFTRLRSLLWFFLAALYFIFAQTIATHAAVGLGSGEWTQLISRCILLFLLIVGYAAMGYAGQRQSHPVRDMGLVARPGGKREFALGAALGWGGMAACVLVMALAGGLVITFWTEAHQYFLLGLDILVLLVAALAAEVAFRGYPFQRLIDAIGPAAATLVMALIYAFLILHNPYATGASFVVTFLLGWLLALAYLRTRALWVGWGFHFAWNASMGLLFGLPVSGLTGFSPVISSVAPGPEWFTGGYYGPESSVLAIIALLVLIVVLFKVTRDYAYKYAQPVIVPGGIPVDIDAAARRQHEAAMGTVAAAPEPPPLVQIAPAPTSPPIGEVAPARPPEEQSSERDETPLS